MFQHQGIWLPDGEKHFPEWMDRNGELVEGKGTYQIGKLRRAMLHVKQWRTAVDVGAHVGLWSMHLARRFNLVVAFEPVAAYRHCFYMNAPGVKCFPCALGAEAGEVMMQVPALEGGIDSGGTHAVPGSGTHVRTLDSFKLAGVDFVKIDCEGYEEHVILGARETLQRCQPCVIVEQKPHKLAANYGTKGTPAVDLLRELGAEVRDCISGDYIMAWQ